MHDPIIRELRRVRARYLQEMKRDLHRFVVESNELLEKISDVVISPNGERQFILSATKMHDVLIAPKLQPRSPQRPGTQARRQRSVEEK